MASLRNKIAGSVLTLAIFIMTFSVLNSVGILTFIPQGTANTIIGLGTPLFVLSWWIKKLSPANVNKVKRWFHL